MNVLRNYQQKLIALLLTMTSCVISAQAAAIGTIYQNDPTPTDASIVPSTILPNATFTTPEISYDAHVGGTTASTFLTFFSPDGCCLDRVPPTFTNGQNGFDPTAAIYNSLIQFTGQVYLNAGSDELEVDHFGGVVLTIAGIGTVVNQPSSSSPPPAYTVITAPTAGYYNFVLNYAAYYSLAAPGPQPQPALNFAVNGTPVGSVPEPASMALLGSGLFGLAALAWRRKN